jgi:hypothetical protein
MAKAKKARGPGRDALSLHMDRVETARKAARRPRGKKPAGSGRPFSL